MAKKILFLINGEGLGNSTRCHAIIEKLLKNNVKIGLVVAKNSYWYFSKKKLPLEIYEIDQFSYHISKDGDLSTYKTILKTFNSINLFKKNLTKIKEVVKAFKPEIIISDSNYVFNFLKKFKIPIVAINNSCITIDEYKRYPKIPYSIKPHYYFVEKLDYFYHKTFPDLSISCGITHKEAINHKNFKNVRPIYRENLKIKKDEKKKTCLIMLSGASNLKSFIDLSFINDEIIFLNKPNNFKESKNIKFIPKLHDNLEYLNKADYFIMNSGYSAITEAIHMKKPMITMPINNHSEQWLNAKKVEGKNYGLVADLSNLREKYYEFCNNFLNYKNSLDNCNDDEINGSEEISNLIMKF
jgi:uncharacterized protein (TIGR00661 family)